MKFFHHGYTLSALVLASVAVGCGGGDTSGTGGTGGSTSTGPVCGNGTVEDGEQCDDGDKNADTAACKTDCTPAACGDSLVGPAEECDDGAANSDTGACTAMCKKAICGDAVVQQGVETCDNGANNGDTKACTAACKEAACGDSLVQEGVEECDDGAANADNAGCTLACKTNVCGDGKVQNGKEECDDGAANGDTAACTGMCKAAKCGDGLVQVGVEGCDDANMVNDDACTNTCALPSCGDGVLQMGEQCDLGAQNSNTGACTTLCKTAACGDGFTQMGVEECDNAAQNNNAAACTATCKNAKCGDGFVQAGVEQCDLAAQNSNTGGCTLMCKSAKCGDGFVQSGIEVCDDGNMTNADGCNNDCVASGTPLWTQTYNGSIGTGAYWSSVATDSMGNAYVTGVEASVAQGFNIVVRKYGPNGAVQWTQTANGTANADDYGQGIAVDAAGNVFVIGYTNNTGTGEDIFIRKYNGMTGATIWTQAYNGPLNTNDEGYGVAVNTATGDIYVAGAVQNVAGQSYNIWYAKLAGINGTVVYQNAINGAANDIDGAIGVAADANNNFVVTGFIRPAAGVGDVWTTYFKDNINSATVTWTRTFNGLSNADDQGSAVAFDPMGNIVVAGVETVNGQNYNTWLRKYDVGGNVVWTQGYNGVANQSDVLNGVAVDSTGNIVVSGAETGANLKGDIWVRKYTSAGATLWTKTYNGNLDDNDQSFFCAVDTSANAYVAGYETIAGPLTQSWLRKYAP